MDKIILFGGTTEGRILGELLSKKHLVISCVATDYGEKLLDLSENLIVHTGRLDMNAMKEFFSRENPQLVVDATHPYAVEVSENIKNACLETDFEYLRVLRTQGNTVYDGIKEFKDLSELSLYLDSCEGNIFSTLGAKELKDISCINGYKDRVFARVLPLKDSLDACINSGLAAKHIICMQGPFSHELNLAMFRACDAKIVISKFTGKKGGFDEKLSAAKELGIEFCVIKKPEETGIDFEDLCKKIEREEI